MRVIGLDLGRRNVKLCDGETFLNFPSIVGEYRELRFEQKVDSKGFLLEYNGEKSFIGSLARNESEFARQLLIEEKATNDAKLLGLTALHRVVQNGEAVRVVTGVPVNMHKPEVKSSMVNLLRGSHTVKVNNVLKEFIVEEVLVSVEGGGAFWSNPREGKVRIIDAGSVTTNYITVDNKRYIDRESGTIRLGFDTTLSSNLEHMASVIAGKVGQKWSSSDQVYVVGGMAKQLASALTMYFPKTSVYEHSQRVTPSGEIVDLNLYANAIGYYNIGRSV